VQCDNGRDSKTRIDASVSEDVRRARSMSCSKMMTMAAIDVVQQADDGDVSASGSSCLSDLNTAYCILLGETLLWFDC
jgi:hypothetical protein